MAPFFTTDEEDMGPPAAPAPPAEPAGKHGVPVAPPAPPEAPLDPLPVPPPAPGGDGGDLRMVVFIVPGGRITYYPVRNFMTGECNHPAHGKCVLQRTCNVGEGKKEWQGRPLGLLLSWLKKGRDLASKDEHWHRLVWPQHEERHDARLAFLTSDSADAVQLRRVERKPRPDEGPEPVGCPFAKLRGKQL